MNRTSIRSSNLESVGYDANQQILEIEFKDDLIYVYDNVPIDTYEMLMNAPSHGKYFNENIRDVYECRRTR